MNPIGKRILSAAMLPVVLFSIVWTSFALWRCQSDGIARPQCCCPKDAAAVKAERGQPATASMIAPACCEIERHEVDRAPAEAGSSSAAQLSAMLASVVALPVALLPELEPAVPRLVPVDFDEGGPPRGRHLLALKQTLLI